MRKLLLALLFPVVAVADPVFKQLDDPALTHVYSGGWEHFVGGGVAGFDCNGDDLPELYLAGGAGPATLLRNRSGNDGLQFHADTPDNIALTGATGAYPIDIDSDGLTDLVILRVGANVVMRGTGDCRFEEMDIGLTFADRWTTAFSATWMGDNRLPTLAFGNYVDRHDPKGPFEACDQNILYLTIDDRYAEPQMLQPGFCALSMLFSDWSRRGQVDLRISNDRHYFVRGGGEQLWRVTPSLRLIGKAEGWRHLSIWGMGIASRDLTGDGLPEVFLTSMGDQKLRTLQGNGARPTYADAPFKRGITAHRPYIGGDGRPSTGWHAAFGDVDNDGRDDLFIAKGNVEAMPGSAMVDPNNLLMQQADGTFVEKGDVAGIASTLRGRGAALTDLDLDGRLDLVVVNRGAPVEIWRNETPKVGAWVALRLRQGAPNRDAVGAWIEVRVGDATYSREVTVGGGHAGGVLADAHFGLGTATAARVRVIWSDGAISSWKTIPINRRTVLQRDGRGSDLVLQ